MLGEDHSLLIEFPEFKSTIEKLVEIDTGFAKDTSQYNELDKTIRQLELRGSPISDDEMHQKKHDRAVLKDSLYQRLLKASKS